MFWNRHRTAAAGPRFSTPALDLDREVEAAFAQHCRLLEQAHDVCLQMLVTVIAEPINTPTSRSRI